MTDPYLTVVNSSIYFLFILIILFLYYKFYIKKYKKKINYLFVILLLSFPPILSIFRPGSYESGDLTLHTVRFISFFHAISDGVLLPQWSGDLNAGFGEPVFLIAQTFPYHISLIFHLLGFSFVDSLKVFLAVSFIASGITMYFWAKEEFGTLPGFAAAICYLFAPYHLVDLHFRANPGETLAFVFAPLVMLAVRKIFQTKKRRWFVIGAISTGCLIAAHPTALITFPFIFLYTLFLFIMEKKKKKALFLSVFALLLGVGLAAYYWLPEILLGKFTHQSFYYGAVSYQHILDFIYSPWRFGLLFQGHKGELSFAMGYVQLIFLAIAIVLLIKKVFSNSEKKYLIFYLTVFFVALFLMLEISKPIWDLSAILRNLQFAYRIMVLEIIVLAAIVGITAKKLPKKWVLILCFIAVGITILNWGNRRTIPAIDDAYIIKQLPQSSYLYEGSAPAAPMWTDPKNVWVKNIPNSYLEVVSGDAEVKQTFRNSVRHEYVVNTKKQTHFKENTLYFPGWSLRVNNQNYPISYMNKKYPGIIMFNLPKGLYKLEVTYTNTPTQHAAQLISLFSGLFLVVYGFRRKKSLNKL